MDDRLQSLYDALDARLAGLLAPLARQIAGLLSRSRDSRTKTVDERRLPLLRARLDDLIAEIFGDSPAAQFGENGSARTPIARLVGGGIRVAARMGIEPLIADVARHTANHPDIAATLATGRGGAPPPLLVDPARTWVDPNGYRLSDRLWQSGQGVRDSIDALLTDGIGRGANAVSLGEELEQFLTIHGRTTGRLIRVKTPDGTVRMEREPFTTRTPYGTKGLYVPRRLARTETARAYGAATQEAARLNPWTKAVGWRLSASHPEEDECDRNASRDDHGLGRGNYPPDRVPTFPNHPQDLCFLVAVPVENPEAIIDDLGRWVRGEPNERFNALDGTPIEPEALVDRLTGIVAAQVGG